jgi:antitoxin component of MazEF toxin-antitoxin module
MQYITRKLGNSIGILFPKEFVKRNNIKPNQKIDVPEIFKVADFTDIFGNLKMKRPTEEIIKEIDKGWD